MQGRSGIVVVRSFKNPIVTVLTVPSGLMVGQRLALKGNRLLLDPTTHDAVAGGAGDKRSAPGPSIWGMSVNPM